MTDPTEDPYPAALITGIYRMQRKLATLLNLLFYHSIFQASLLL